MRATEKTIHIDVARFLALALPMRAIWNHSPDGGSRHPIEAAQFRAMGTRAGWLDIEIVWGGKAHFIELKTAVGRLSSAQIGCHAGLADAGALVAVCRSVDEVETTLRGWGIPLRASIQGIAA